MSTWRDEKWHEEFVKSVLEAILPALSAAYQAKASTEPDFATADNDLRRVVFPHLQNFIKPLAQHFAAKMNQVVDHELQQDELRRAALPYCERTIPIFNDQGVPLEMIRQPIWAPRDMKLGPVARG
jgi:hypothetical protein